MTWSNYSYHNISGDADQYGWTVALSGDGMTFAVGAPMWYHNTNGEAPGQVRVFQAIDSSGANLAGRESAAGQIAEHYQAPENTVWALLELALTEISSLKSRVAALEV